MTRPTSTSATRDACWYALAVLARQEKSALEDMRRRGFESWLPLRVERRAWSDRIQNVELALFPGYVFVKTALDVQKRLDLLKVRGAHDLVGRLPGDARIARAIPDSEIESLRTVVDTDRAIDPLTKIVPGARVRVVFGPLKGAFGILERGLDGQRRLVVQVALLGRGVRTVLSADDVVEDLVVQAA
jgi:transcriptional antiterminator NusG